MQLVEEGLGIKKRLIVARIFISIYYVVSVLRWKSSEKKGYTK